MRFHLLHQVLAGARIGQIEPILIYEHGLLLEPISPGLFRDGLINTATQIAGCWWEVEARGLTLEFDALDGARHGLEYAMDKIWIQAALVASGAVLGAWLRWAMGLAFNGVFTGFLLGTLAVNVLGGFLAGGLLAWASTLSTQALPEWARLLIMTGFLGSLTTFSALTAEMLPLLQAGRMMWALVLAAAHVGLALVAAGFGFYLIDFMIKK